MMKTSEFLVDLYRDRAAHEPEAPKRTVWKELGRFLQQYINETAYVIDLGSGDNCFLNSIHCRCGYGIDLRNGVSWRRIYDYLPVDVVFTSNFLEHLASIREIDFCLRAIHHQLSHGGKIVIMGPNILYTGPKYWDFADHKVPLTDRTVVELLRKNGFLIDEWHPRFLPYSFQSPLPKWPWLVRLYLKLPFLWHIFGEQMLIVAHKGES